MHGGHLSSIAKCLMVSTKSVSVKLNKNMKIYNVRGDFEYQNLLKYVKSNP